MLSISYSSWAKRLPVHFSWFTLASAVSTLLPLDRLHDVFLAFSRTQVFQVLYLGGCLVCWAGLYDPESDFLIQEIRILLSKYSHMKHQTHNKHSIN